MPIKAVPRDLFIETWNAAKSAQDVVEKLGYKSCNVARQRATKLRNRGYVLKRFAVKGRLVDRKKFVRVYRDSDDRYEVARRLGMNLDYVHVLAWHLRKAGVKLKQFKRGPQSRQPRHSPSC